MVTRRHALALALLAIVTTVRLAAAEEAAPRTWYGEHVMIVDGAAAALIVAGIKRDSDSGIVGGLGLYALGAPTVHMAHDRLVAGAASLTARLLFPVMGAVLGGAIVGPGPRGFSGDQALSPGIPYGFLVGMLLASSLDLSLLSWERGSSATTPAGGMTAASLGVAPVRGGSVVTMGGAF